MNKFLEEMSNWYNTPVDDTYTWHRTNVANTLEDEDIQDCMDITFKKTVDKYDRDSVSEWLDTFENKPDYEWHFCKDDRWCIWISWEGIE